MAFRMLIEIDGVDVVRLLLQGMSPLLEAYGYFAFIILPNTVYITSTSFIPGRYGNGY